jgi:murein DD-endopeptidase MepM/ murein hydrolase activator NlpD
MSVRYGLVFLLVLTAAVFAYPQESVHVVQRGDTIYSIARSYGVSQEAILSLNNIGDSRRIQVGQQLKIPGQPTQSAQSAQSGTAAYTEYRVVRGDTLYSIARRFSITLPVLRNANNLAEEHIIKIGDILRIPGDAVQVSETAGTGASGGSTTTAQVLWPVQAKEVRYMNGKLQRVILTGEGLEPVKSLTQGTVVSAGPYRGFGKVAIVQVTGGYLYVYGGCETLSVKEGDRVAPGTELGRLGDGLSAKPDLTFMVYQRETPIDPAKAPRL